MTTEQTEYAAAYPHDPITEVIPDLFVVRGSVAMNRLMRITRNMAIIRHEGELTLVNPIRLEAAEEQALLALGSIKRLLRLGGFHGMDDRYYKERFEAELWASGKSKAHPEPAVDRIIGSGDTMPFPDAHFVDLAGTKQHESALCISRDGGVLLTCDAVQHYGDYKHNTVLARIAMPFIGFPKTTVIGPLWLKSAVKDRAAIEQSLRALLDLKFDKLLAAHGSVLETGAHAALRRAIDKAFPTE